MEIKVICSECGGESFSYNSTTGVHTCDDCGARYSYEEAKELFTEAPEKDNNND